MKMYWPGGLKNRYLVETLKWLALIVITGCVVWGGYETWHHFSKPKTHVPADFIKQHEDATQQSAQSYLSNKDYESYQAIESSLARNYLTNNDSQDAQRIMDGVLKNVPANQLTYTSLAVLMNIAQSRHDNSKTKLYGQQLIKLLNSQSDTVGAQQIQAQIDGLK